MKLAVYAIAKNEAQFVARWYESVKDADEIVVMDTGSEDNTVELLEELGVKVVRMHFEPFRFDSARNASLNLVSEDVDYCFFLDMDETLPEDSIQRLRDEIEKDPRDMYSVKLVYSFDKNRQPIISYNREACHRRQGFYWKYPVHELLACYSPKYLYKELDIPVFHEPDTSKSRASYLPLLEMAAAEFPDDPRCIQYLGREYMYYGRHFDALMWLKRHVEVEPYGQLRSESATYIAKCYLQMSDSMEGALDESEAWHYRAIAEFNSAREPYCELASLYFACGEYECAIGAIRNALRIEVKPAVSMIFQDEYYTYWPYHMLAACYHNIGYDKLARENIQLAMQYSSTISGPMANDIFKILGLSNVDQFIPGGETEEVVPQ